MAIKSQTDAQQFPYSMFPYKLIHKDGKDLKETKTCYFQFQAHVDKYLERSKLKSKDYQLHIKPGTNVETLGKSTGRKGTQKRSNRRSGSSS